MDGSCPGHSCWWGAASGSDAHMQPVDDEDVDMAAVPGVAAQMHCPVPGCVAASGSGHAGWETFAGLRAHLDAHILGLLPVQHFSADTDRVCLSYDESNAHNGQRC